MVSVIIPNYNHAPFLQKRIESVLNQSYTDLELILLDDCSTDNSIDIINQYKKHPKVSHIVINSINSGSPFIQWEKAFKLASGEVVWIAESDDYAEPDFLEKLMPCFQGRVGLVYADSNVVDAQDVVHKDFYKKFRNERFKTTKWNKDYQENGIQELKENLFFECTINNMSATLFRRELLKFVDFEFLKKFRYCGDWFFLVSLAMHCDIAYKSDALNYFKYGTDNFKKGTRSVLNYFKERAWVKYYFWNALQTELTGATKKDVYKQLADEMKIQVNEVTKGKSSLKGTLQMMKDLKKLDRSMFNTHLKATLKKYVWRK